MRKVLNLGLSLALMGLATASYAANAAEDELDIAAFPEMAPETARKGGEIAKRAAMATPPSEVFVQRTPEWAKKRLEQATATRELETKLDNK
jgi:hypothetical protein